MIDDPISNPPSQGFPSPPVLTPEPGTDVIMPMVGPRDPDIAVREEFDAAVRANTIAGYELFIARHPDSPLVAQARERLDALKG